MALSDQEFREEFKPIYVPAEFVADDSLENKIIFALAQIGEGNFTEVIKKLEELESGISNDQVPLEVEEFLKDKFDKGLLNGSTKNGINSYNLSKITNANKGTIDPDLLAPGLD